MAVVLLISALLIGCLLAVQASVNLQLNKAVGTPYGASTLQLCVAVVLLAVVAAAAGAFGALAGITDVPAWYLLGGLASPLYITSAILLFRRLGALAAGGLFVTGQMLASVGLDVFGLFGLPRQPVTPGIVVGAVAVLAGITLIVRGQQQPTRAPAAAPVKGAPVAGGPRRDGPGTATAPPAHPARVATVGWLLLGLVAGAVLPVQGAINARLRSVIDQPIAVALASFIVAALTISLVLAALLVTGRTARPRLPGAGMPWWGWLGGACAAGYVTGTFLLIPAIGAAVTVALTVTGQQLASAVIDSRGWFRLPRRHFTSQRGTGLVGLIAGSMLIQLL
jgi:transporter family-2 protein